MCCIYFFFFFQAEDGIRDIGVTGVQTCALPICAGAEVPCVILNVVRGGPGLGSIQPSQSDYFMTTRGGGDGDYRTPVYAPASVQEACDMIQDAFDVAEKIGRAHV